MKRAVIILTIFFLPIMFSCKGQKNSNNMNGVIELPKYPVSIGLGTLDISFNLPVPLYLSENDEQPFDTLSFEKQFNGVILFKTNRIGSLNPYSMSGGDSNKAASENIRRGLIRFPAVLTFRVLEADHNFYRIVVNEKTFETVVIKKNPEYAMLPKRELFGPSIPKDKPYKGYYIYETWEHLLLRAEFVDFDIDYEVYDKPEGNVIYKNIGNQFLPYNVTEVKGDWIKVKKSVLRESYFDGIEKAEGWVKWKSGNKILVKIVEYTVE